MEGLFITFEGGEGGGKTTQVQKLSEWMKSRGIAHIVTKEPGCELSVECKKIRKLLLEPSNDLAARTELLLFLADRAQHVEKVIKPHLQKGVHVLCDRYSDSTRVYQCARGLSRSKVDLLLDFTTDSLDPNLTFILDVPVTVGLERARAKSIYKDGDRMEMAGIKFHEDVRHGFLKLTEGLNGGNRFALINAAPPRTIEDIHNEVVKVVSNKLWTEQQEYTEEQE